jgi:hypothetical protein
MRHSIARGQRRYSDWRNIGIISIYLFIYLLNDIISIELVLFYSDKQRSKDASFREGFVTS